MTALLTEHQVSSPPQGVYLIGNDDARLIVWVLPFGARIMQIFVKMAENAWRPVTLGFRDPEQYRDDTASLGAICGRYANRLGGSCFSIGAKTIKLNTNHELGHCLHGGEEGFSVSDWTVHQHSKDHIDLMRHSANGDMGFPGECEVRCQYRISENELAIEIDASVTETSPLNLVQHAYFCLNDTDIQHHRLQIRADQRLLTGEDELPTRLDSVEDSAEDFRSLRTLLCGDRYQAIDRAFLLNVDRRDTPTLAGCLRASDLQLEVYTTERLLHVYTAGNLMEIGTPLGPDHRPRHSVCLESEDWPNGPNIGKNVWYKPGDDYRQVTRWCFSRL